MKLKDLRAGDVVEIDSGFTCMKSGEHTVHLDSPNCPYLQCSEGKHFLDGQENFDEPDIDLVGVKWPNEDWPT